MAESCVWVRQQHWPTGNESTLFKPGCKDYRRVTMDRGWKFCPFCGKQIEQGAPIDQFDAPASALETGPAPAIKVGDQVRVTLGVHSAIPADGWRVIGLPGEYRKTYHLEHDNGGSMTIDREYVVPV